jgi:nitrate/nitrite transport system ATP-binding protein
MQKSIHIEGVQMHFATKQGTFVALKDINLKIERGEFITLIGHSGCGKSTLLNLIAGLRGRGRIAGWCFKITHCCHG